MLSGNVRLIGRDVELSLITSDLSGSPGAAVVIAGRAGVGKSRLATEVATLAAASGRPVARVIATQGGAAIPFGAFASLLPESASLGKHPVELIQGFCRSMEARAEGERSLLLVVDDAQFLDAGSAALVHQLVVGQSCGLVVTARTPDLAPDPIVSLWKEGLARRVEIQDLSRRETDALVASFLAGPVSGSALRWLWDVSAGNPLFVRELLIGGEEAGSVYLQDGIWFLCLPLPAPSRLKDLIASRLATVAPGTAEVVDLLAIGEPLPFDDLVRITGHEAVEDAENRGLITVADENGRTEVRLSHPLYREVIGQRIPRGRLRRLSATLAETVEARPAPRPDDILRVARWQLDAGTASHPELLEQAARIARSARDLPSAARFAGAALAAGGGVTAGLFLGETEFMTGRHSEAETVLAGLVPLCRTDRERTLIANARNYNLGVLMGDQQAAAAVLEEALATVVDPLSRHHLLVRRAINAVYSGRLTDALAVTDELMESGDEGIVRRGCYARSLALAMLGRTEEAVAIGYRSLEDHRRRLLQDPDLAAAELQSPEDQLLGPVIGHILGGRLTAAESDARLGGEIALDHNDPEAQATFSLLLGWILIERGLVADAAKAFREGAAINRDLFDEATLRWCLAGIALAEAMAGNVGAARAAEAELSKLATHWFGLLDPHLVDRSRGWLLIASGELTPARNHLRDAADRARASNQSGAEAILLHDLVRMGEARTVATRLAELEAIVDGDLVPIFAAHANARAAGDASALEAAATSFERIGAMMMAAEAAQSAARAYESAGALRRANSSARESARLYEMCGVARSPLAVEVDSVVPLTRRELEIALLAGGGLSSREVAERLYLSVRTVDNHLQHVYAKLGVSSREELARALPHAGLEGGQSSG